MRQQTLFKNSRPPKKAQKHVMNWRKEMERSESSKSLVFGHTSYEHKFLHPRENG